MFMSSVYVRNSKYAGEKWYQIRLQPDTHPDRSVDVRPFGPLLPTYLFLAEALRQANGESSTRFTTKEVIEGVAGINRMAGTSLYLTSFVSGNTPEKTIKEAIPRWGGEFLGGFFTPFRTWKDFVAHFSEEEAKIRDIRQEPFLGRAKEAIPFLSQTLPERKVPTREETPQRELPAVRQFTGLTFRTKNEIEKEIDRLGIKRIQIAPKHIVHLCRCRVVFQYCMPYPEVNCLTELVCIVPHAITKCGFILIEVV